MAHLLLLVTVTLFYWRLISASPIQSDAVRQRYNVERQSLLDDNNQRRFGDSLVLDHNEKTLDDIIINKKSKLMESSRINKTLYWPSTSFYQSKSLMKGYDLHRLIKAMPKGGALHLHDVAITSLDWMIQNLTYRANVWMCINQNNYVILAYSPTTPTDQGCSPWTTVESQRRNFSSPTAFDNWLARNISYLSTDPVLSYKNGDEAWVRFTTYFSQISSFLSYAPFMRDYFHQALVEFLKDGVQYIELRSQLYGYYEFTRNGTKIIHDAQYGVELYKNVTDEFKKNNPTFIGAKIIFSGLRFRSVDEILKEVKTAIELHKTYPDIFLGYDLVGQEDPLQPLKYYLDALLYPMTLDPPYYLPYFFHAAETNWQGTQVDLNLIDALLLNTTRIGHGYGLAKHPELVEKVKHRKIAIEINPISNQVLRLVSDVRNHALVPLLTDDFPAVVSSDDPGAWESAPLSDDFFVALMNMAGMDSGLKFLKKLAINSIEYSGMKQQEKKEALCKWETAWNNFVLKELKANGAGHVEVPFNCKNYGKAAKGRANDGNSTLRNNFSKLFLSLIYVLIWFFILS